MKLAPIFLKELEQEAEITRKFFERVPDDKFDWAPHEKSMKIGRLVAHMADLAAWPEIVLEADGIDFENNDWVEEKTNNREQLLEAHTLCVARGKKAVEKVLNAETEDFWNNPWTMQSGNYVIGTNPKHEVMRMALNQTVHHRAQLGVYLRLLNIPIPGSYGPSADEQ